MKPIDPPNDTAAPNTSSASSPEDQMVVEAKSLLASKTVLGIVVALLPSLLRLGHVELTEADLQGAAGDVLSILGSALAIYGRITARQPVRFSPPKSDSVDLLLLAIALGALLWFTGCTAAGGQGGGTRWVESVSLKGGATRDGETGDTSGSGEVTIRFRDGRDAKTIRPLSLRRTFDEPAVSALGHPLPDPFLAASTIPNISALSAQ